MDYALIKEYVQESLQAELLARIGAQLSALCKRLSTATRRYQDALKCPPRSGNALAEAEWELSEGFRAFDDAIARSAAVYHDGCTLLVHLHHHAVQDQRSDAAAVVNRFEAIMTTAAEDIAALQMILVHWQADTRHLTPDVMRQYCHYIVARPLWNSGGGAVLDRLLATCSMR
jgi:hypothetical protein